MERIGEIIKSNKPQPHSGGQLTTEHSSSKNSLAWVQQLELMAQNMRQDWMPGQITYWATELKPYTDDEILVALGLYTGEFFPNVKQIREIIDRKRRMVSNKAWEKWKAEDAQGQRATPEEIDAMVAGCKRAWERVVNGRDGGTETNRMDASTKAKAVLVDGEGA